MVESKKTLVNTEMNDMNGLKGNTSHQFSPVVKFFHKHKLMKSVKDAHNTFKRGE